MLNIIHRLFKQRIMFQRSTAPFLGAHIGGPIDDLMLEIFLVFWWVGVDLTPPHLRDYVILKEKFGRK